MDKCPKCGNKLSSIDVLCPRCGTLVEVVQVKKSAGTQAVPGTYGSTAKKAPQQNLIVYNDDLPADDIFESPEPEPEVEDIAESGEPALADTEALPYDLLEMKPEPYSPELHSEEPEVGSEEDYLALLRKMNLSALDEIDEIASVYSDKKSEPVPSTDSEADDFASAYSDEKSEPVPSTDSETDDFASFYQYEEPEPTPSADVPHRWLEIEELVEAGEAQPRPMQVQNASPASPTPPAPPPPIFMSSEEQRRYHARAERDRKSAPHRSAGRVVLMIFVWLVITCGVFCGFYFFDQYVIGHYGSYQTMVHDISGGQIELGTSADAAPDGNGSP